MTLRDRRGARSRVAPIVCIRNFALAFALTIINRPDATGAGLDPQERHVSVGTRRLFVSCSGDERGPVVVLIAGGSFSTEVWSRIQRPLSTGARVCSVDRAGVGRSDPSPRPQAAEEIVADIHGVLRQAGEDPPYVLVGHSVGGIYARMFSARFPESVGALVLVDSAHEEQIWRLAAFAPALVDAEYGSAWRDLKARRALGFLGDGEILKWDTKVPLIVLQQGRDLPERPELGLTKTVIPQVTALWRTLQTDLASRSPSGELRTALRSGHFIQTDEPEMVVQAVRDALARLAATEGQQAARDSERVEKAVAQCASYATPTVGQRLSKPAFKGVELYSWRSETGGFNYSLLWGTNRNKSEGEVKRPACTLRDIPAVKTALSHLAKGEWVTWRGDPEHMTLAYPSPEVINALRAHSKELGITLNVPSFK